MGPHQSELLLESTDNSRDHVVNQCTGQTVQLVGLTAVVQLVHGDLLALLNSGHALGQHALKLALGALYRV